MSLKLISIIIISIIMIVMLTVKEKFLKKYFIIISILLSTVAFFFDPPSGFDLSRHYDMLEATRKYGFEYIINHNDYKNLPVGAIYMYLISKLGNNGWLPFITCFISYMSIFLIIIDVTKEKKISRKALVLTTLIFLVMYNYIGLISGIRNKLCISIFTYILYNDLIKKKNNILCFIFYILLCFIHPTIFVLLIIRLLLLRKNKASIVIEVILLLWTLMKNGILEILSAFTSVPILQYIVHKMSNYGIEEAFAVANVPLYVFVYLTRFIILFFIFLKFEKCTSEDSTWKQYNIFIRYLFCFVLGSITEYHFFTRFSELLLILNVVPMLYLLSDKLYNINSKKLLLLPNTILKMTLYIESFMFFIFLFWGQYEVLF